MKNWIDESAPGIKPKGKGTNQYINLNALSDHAMIVGSAFCIGMGTDNTLIGLGVWLGLVAIYRVEKK